MLDLNNLQKYRENNRIEAKQAMGGLPESIWETYSAFANTLGGVILLGVEELPDKSLQAMDLPDPEWMVEDILAALNDPKRVNINLLTQEDVQIHEVDGKHIIAITVPQAKPGDKPVYIGSDRFRGTYRRDGEGDYRCTHEEVEAMLAKRQREV